MMVNYPERCKVRSLGQLYGSNREYRSGGVQWQIREVSVRKGNALPITTEQGQLHGLYPDLATIQYPLHKKQVH
jgi:hypothetical protein